MGGRATGLVMVVVLAACAKQLSLPPSPGTPLPGTFYGRAVVAKPGRADRAAAPGTLVTLLGSSLSTVAGDNGEFLLDGIVQNAGVVLLRHGATAAGGFDHQHELLLQDFGAGPGRQIGAGEIALGENARVGGRILLADRATPGGHAGTTVYVPGGPFLALTADDGSWALSDLPSGSVDIAILRAGYAPHSWGRLLLQGGEEVVLRQVALDPVETPDTTGTLAGKVVLLGTPETDAPISAAVADAEQRWTALPVAADGTFEKPGLPAGLYSLSVSRAGYLSATLPGIAVLPGERTELQVPVVLAPGTSASDCVEGADCAPDDPCRQGTVRCVAGGVQCVPGELREAGSACGPGRVCSPEGSCRACSAGAACTPENTCHVGQLDCSSGEPACADTGTAVAAGTACGVDRVCSPAGECLDCASGKACSAGPCRIGALACGGGEPSCEDLGLFLPAGTTCGGDKVCSAGAECVGCVGGVACTPANRCRVGETRCDTGELRCADTGQAVAAGTSCGTGRVCDPTGTCVACSAGADCVPGDPCHVGAIECGSGEPVCADTGVARPPGTRCGDGFVCAASGACIACVEGSSCAGPVACRGGAVACASGAPVCQATPRLLAPGTPCGTDQVCDPAGDCVACVAGAECAPVDKCHVGRITCGSGAAVCVDTLAPRPPGTRCGAGLVCDPSGACMPCAAGADCVPGNPCHAGKVVCDTGLAGCADQGSNVPAGTACAPGKVCSPEALCVACAEGSACAGPVPCRGGAVACASGAPVCQATTARLVAGTACGTDQVCDTAGDCVACTAGVACTPANPCHQGRSECSSGASACADTQAAQPAGTPCGPGQVCTAAGACAPCAAGSGCVPSNPCQTGVVQCATGAPVCAEAGTDLADGTVCGTDRVCRAGACVACAQGVACTPSNPCRRGRTDCSTGESACVDAGTDAANGTSCGTLMVCVAGACLPSGLAVESGDNQTGYPGQLLAAIVFRMTNGAGAPVANETITLTGPPGSVVVPTTGKTDLNGRFYTTWRLPRQPGTYPLAALSQSGQAAQASATALELPAGHVHPLVNTDHSAGADGAPGPGLAAHMRQPQFFVRASDGTIYVSDTAAEVVRALSPQGHWTVVAGTVDSYGFSGDGGLATAAKFGYPAGLALDEKAGAKGRLYIADYGNDRIRAVDLATGVINAYAGGGTMGVPYGDGGPAAAANIDGPGDLAIGPDGALWFADTRHDRIRRIGAADTVVTTPVSFTSCLEPGTLAGCDPWEPTWCRFTWDSATDLYVAGKVCGNGTGTTYPTFPGVLRVAAGGSKAVVAGKTGASTASGNAATETGFTGPLAVAADAARNLYVAETTLHQVRRIEATTSRVTTVAGNGSAGGTGDFGPAAAARFSSPTAIAFEPDGSLLLAENGNYSLRRIAAFGRTAGTPAVLSRVAGDGQQLLPSQVSQPFSVALADGAGTPLGGYTVQWKVVDPGGALYSAASATNASGVVSSVARAGLALGSYRFEASFTDLLGRPATGSPVQFTLVAGAPAAGIIFPVLNADHSPALDGLPGPAAKAHIRSAYAVARAPDGTLFVTDQTAGYVIKITPAGHASVVAGNGGNVSAGDGGPATSASLASPHGLAVSPDGRSLFIADWLGARVRAVDLVTGIISTYAGPPPPPASPPPGPGYGDGGAASSNANLNQPTHLAIGPDGALYITDRLHHSIRRVDPATGLIGRWPADGALYTGTCTDPIHFVGCNAAWSYANCHLTWDPAGNAYLAAEVCGTSVATNQSPAPGIVKRAPDGTLSHFSGRASATGTPPASNADGTSIAAFLWVDVPMLAWVDATTAYAVERNTNKLYLLDLAANTVRRVAGNGAAGYLGDYVPLGQAQLNKPWAPLWTPEGRLLLPDGENATLRMVW